MTCRIAQQNDPPVRVPRQRAQLHDRPLADALEVLDEDGRELLPALKVRQDLVVGSLRSRAAGRDVRAVLGEVGVGGHDVDVAPLRDGVARDVLSRKIS